MEEIERNLQDKIDNLEIFLKETEKKTLWKIEECEQLLHKRINNQYVDSSIKILEEKMQKLVIFFHVIILLKLNILS